MIVRAQSAEVIKGCRVFTTRIFQTHPRAGKLNDIPTLTLALTRDLTPRYIYCYLTVEKVNYLDKRIVWANS